MINVLSVNSNNLRFSLDLNMALFVAAFMAGGLVTGAGHVYQERQQQQQQAKVRYEAALQNVRDCDIEMDRKRNALKDIQNEIEIKRTRLAELNEASPIGMWHHTTFMCNSSSMSILY